MNWCYFINGFFIGFLIVYDFSILWMLIKTRAVIKLLESDRESYILGKGIDPIGEIIESPDLAYMKEKGFIK